MEWMGKQMVIQYSIFKLQASRMRSSQLWQSAVGCNEGVQRGMREKEKRKRRLGDPCDVGFAHGLLYRHVEQTVNSSLTWFTDPRPIVIFMIL